MNATHDVLKHVTILAELNAEGDILERHFLLLNGHAINVHRCRVDVLSMEGLRTSLRVKRMDGLFGRRSTRRRR